MLLMRVMSGLITVETVGFGSLSPDGSGSSEEGPELRPRVDRPGAESELRDGVPSGGALSPTTLGS